MTKQDEELNLGPIYNFFGYYLIPRFIETETMHHKFKYNKNVFEHALLTLNPTKAFVLIKAVGQRRKL